MKNIQNIPKVGQGSAFFTAPVDTDAACSQMRSVTKTASSPYVSTVPKSRVGGWFLTSTGRRFWPLDPRPEDVCIEDIAHHLSNVCRFGGAVRTFYAVAQHSVFVARLLPPSLRFQGLMHDASEAYVGDMVQPFKAFMPEFKTAETRVWYAICHKFEIPFGLDPLVKHADIVALMTEKRDLMPVTEHRWAEQFEAVAPSAKTIFPQSPSDALADFLHLYRALT